MKKFVLLFVFLLLLPGQALAHTGLEKSVPAAGDTVREPLTRIELSFHTPIDKLSTFFLTDPDGKKIKPDQIDVADNKMTGTFKEPLPNGTYTVNWKIVGEDGHAVEKTFTFSVDVPTASVAPSPSPSANDATPTATVTPAATPTPVPSEAATAAPGDTESAPADGDNNRTAVIVVAVIAAVAAAIAIRYARKRK